MEVTEVTLRGQTLHKSAWCKAFGPLDIREMAQDSGRALNTKNSTLKNLWALTVPAVVLGKPVLVSKVTTRDAQAFAAEAPCFHGFMCTCTGHFRYYKPF